ncbi:MAG: choice-of-anchor D domain-containing protein, partial [Aureispira sp.]
MKIFLYLLLFWISTSFSLQAQINFQGCTAEFGTTTYVFFNTSTTNDGGTIRNTYETTPIDGTQPCNGLGFGFCEFRIIWSVANSRWEFQITDGVSFFMIYSNTSPSAPNPPDLTLGTWIENTANTGGACGGNGTASISTLTGDIQNSVGGGAPEIDVTGNSAGIVDGDATPSTIDGSDFGNVAVSTSALQTFVINNTGTAALNITSIVVSGAQASDFVVSGAPASVAAGASANFTLTFSPSAAGTRNATVTINNDDADEAVYDFAVRGNGTVSPEINLTGNGTGIIDGDATPSTIDGSDFGNVAVSTSALQTFVINNTGTGILTVSSILVSGTQAGDFVVSGAPASVAAGASANFTLTFSPSAAGTRNATVTINNDDADEAVYDFAVTGNGVGSPEISVRGNGNIILDGDVNPITVDGTDFGNVAVST